MMEVNVTPKAPWTFRFCPVRNKFPSLVRAVICCGFAVARYVVKVRNKFFRVFPLNYRRVIIVGVVKD